MYRYTTKFFINEQDKYSDNWTFGIKLKPRTKFKLLNCYIELTRGNVGRESEMLTVEYFSKSDDKDKAEKEIENSLNFLSYLTKIPLDDDTYISVESIDKKIDIIETKNYKKVEHINLLNKKVFDLDKIEPFYHNIKLINTAQKYNYMYGFDEEVFLNYFKVMENIATLKYKKYKKEKVEYMIDGNKIELNSKLKKLLECSWGIQYSESRIDNITKEIEAKINKLAIDGIFFKISVFCKYNNICINPEILQKAIKVRNDIAHGNYINRDDMKDVYWDILNISYEFISNAFFQTKYSYLLIDSMVEPWDAVYKN